MRSSFFAFAATAASTVSAQFVSPPTDLKHSKGYLDIPVRSKQVPEGICETTPDVKSFSGYVDVAEHQHNFFWFFEARNEDPHNAPLTVWINGGPGSSSMIGLFQEIGPCYVNKDGEIYNNPHAWNNVSNMLFIDQPTETGFSYSKAVPGYIKDKKFVQLPDNNCPKNATGCATYTAPTLEDTFNSTINAAPAFWKTLQGFMGAYPQYSRHEFNFATESYGGHYGPIYNEYIEQQNEKIRCGELKGAHHINLKTVLIGNGWFDPLIQYAAFYNFTVADTYDIGFFNESIQQKMYDNMYGPGNCYDQTVECNKNGNNTVCSDADDYCYLNVEYVLDKYANRDEYDVRELGSDPFPPSYFEDYLNTPKVQHAIGAFTNFTGRGAVGTAFGSTGDDDREEGTVEATRKLVEQGVYVYLFAGDADYVCNWIGVEQVAENVNAPGYCYAGYQDIKTSDGIVHGQVKQSGHFAFARIYESGHEVPFYQPVVGLEMFDRAINGRDIATGYVPVKHAHWYRTWGPKESTYREGNDTVQYHDIDPDATYNTHTNMPNKVEKPSRSNRML